jgi:hypothetical protein
MRMNTGYFDWEGKRKILRGEFKAEAKGREEEKRRRIVAVDRKSLPLETKGGAPSRFVDRWR